MASEWEPSLHCFPTPFRIRFPLFIFTFFFIFSFLLSLSSTGKHSKEAYRHLTLPTQLNALILLLVFSLSPFSYCRTVLRERAPLSLRYLIFLFSKTGNETYRSLPKSYVCFFKPEYRQLQRLYLESIMWESCPPHTRFGA